MKKQAAVQCLRSASDEVRTNAIILSYLSMIRWQNLFATLSCKTITLRSFFGMLYIYFGIAFIFLLLSHCVLNGWMVQSGLKLHQLTGAHK